MVFRMFGFGHKWNLKRLTLVEGFDRTFIFKKK